MGGFDIDNSISNSDRDILDQFSTLFHLKSLRILIGKKHPKIKLQCLRKIPILTFGSLVHQITSF